MYLQFSLSLSSKSSCFCSSSASLSLSTLYIQYINRGSSMAANKFATMLHKNTNKTTMILIYAVLEWTLIALLFLNSIFSYFIIKFAQHFGLKPPCLWCTRVDHIFDPDKNKNKHLDLLCEAHAKQISKLGFCSNHQKLSESEDMCEDCLSSKPEFHEVSKKFTFFGMIQTDGEKVVDNGHLSLNCSCCGVNFDSKISSNIVIKSSWDVSEHTQNSNDHIKEDPFSGYEFDHSYGNKDENVMISDVNGDFSVIEKVDVVIEEESEEIVGERTEMVTKDEAIQVSVEEDAQHLEFFIDYSGHRLVRVELIDSATEDDQNRDIAQGDDQGRSDQRGLDSGFEVLEEAKSKAAIEENAEHFEYMNEESVEIEEGEDFLVGNVQVVEAAEEEEDMNSEFRQACDDIVQTQVNETEADVSIGTEIPDLDTADDIQTQDPLTSFVPEADANGNYDHGFMQIEEPIVELRTLSVEVNEHVMNNRAPFCSDLNEIEEEKAPETPTSTDNFHLLHKKLLLLEKKDSVTEDSLDGSVTSELDSGDGPLTIEQLKSTLRAERKALHALYAELEEERNASAVSASQTMAMINRLQEEKSAMQIEALQYQRMMDEQAEYDQEALQLLNELMVKREREKEELEKELEVHKKKLLEYETKEKMRILRRSNGSAKSGFSSPSCSNAEDSDAASFDLNQVAKDEDGFSSHREFGNDNTPVNAVLNLEESVADFEEERLSILEQLKVLEEKLMTFDDEDLQHFEDVRSIEHHEENGNFIDENGHLDGIENGHSNGFEKEINGKRSTGPKGKSLLPLFDAESDDTLDGNENGFDSSGVDESSIPKIELENKRFAIEEELDHLYERLQALEEDREFLKHCIGSLNKGDKGMHILHEILQHLRDLRNVDLRVKNLSDGATV